MSEPRATYRSPDREREAVEAIQEIANEFGPEQTIIAIQRSTLSDFLPDANKDRIVQAINFVLARVIDAEKPRLQADIMGLATGLMLRQGKSQRDIAKKYGMTVANISKLAVGFVEETGLPRGLGNMRPEKDARTYSLTNKSKKKSQP